MNEITSCAALSEGEPDWIANAANIVATLHQQVGFLWDRVYRVIGQKLVLGPFRGPVACTRIKFGRRVCSSACKKHQDILVSDVDKFPGQPMKVCKAESEDIPRIMEVCRQARTIMRADGNMNQWTDGYPSEEIIRKDISNDTAFIVKEGGDIVGYFALIPGIEMTYLRIDEGRWADDTLPYATIHRLASTADSHNVASTCFSFCWERIQNLRIDTHRDNRIMRHCIEKAGFEYCGIIYLAGGDERLAYQKIGSMGY